MKQVQFLLLALLLVGCTTTHVVDSWANPDIESYAPTKVFIVGLTADTLSRQKFETNLKQQLLMRGIEANTSLNMFKPLFTDKALTENEFIELEQSLIEDGFDTILFSKVIGVEDKIVYVKDDDVYDETYVKFQEDYLRYQDIYYNPDYYTEYTVYHAETSMFCICPTEDRTLLWKGYIDIVDPQSIDNSVNDYIHLIMTVLEEQQLINSIGDENMTLK